MLCDGHRNHHHCSFGTSLRRWNCSSRRRCRRHRCRRRLGRSGCRNYGDGHSNSKVSSRRQQSRWHLVAGAAPPP